MISLIIEHAKANEKMAGSSRNLKGTYKQYVRKGTDIQKAAATELARKIMEKLRGTGTREFQVKS